MPGLRHTGVTQVRVNYPLAKQIRPERPVRSERIAPDPIGSAVRTPFFAALRPIPQYPVL